MFRLVRPLALFLFLFVAKPVIGSDFYRLDQALPSDIDVAAIAPIFDFDGDGCLPSAGISRNGEANGGLNPSGSLTGGCRSSNFLETSNTLHRHLCTAEGSVEYCGHFFSLYFEKDQLFSGITSGHRHDWEYVAIWTTNGQITHGSYSAHGDLFTRAVADLPMQGEHMKIVYHKEGLGSHAFRFASETELAENPYGEFVTPVLVNWFELQGDGINNARMRSLLNGFNFGSATIPLRDNNFVANLNEFRPQGYPQFSDHFSQFKNRASNLCLDVSGANMSDGTNVIQWHCSGEPWQKWSYNANTGEIQSLHNPAFCLDNSSSWGDGANVIIWSCNGGTAQQFDVNADRVINMRTQVNQVLDGNGINAGDNVSTWGQHSGDNQRWDR